MTIPNLPSIPENLADWLNVIAIISTGGLAALQFIKTRNWQIKDERRIERKEVLRSITSLTKQMIVEIETHFNYGHLRLKEIKKSHSEINQKIIEIRSSMEELEVLASEWNSSTLDKNLENYKFAFDSVRQKFNDVNKEDLNKKFDFKSCNESCVQLISATLPS